ncbi:hypothetical protein HYN48_11050 [Flavobacterium magnum]|uniref:TonB C-terminal domain-containing protein n=1 Tax=Flavobacterium magnum TaxID=2162713 RepID=A0A2S0RFY7_9FLAO|nr:energy transducer TonB [Flavobacterium magnum]AWA30584.1 hypothetical protein HYN48_11050 [Flavobacterium magnum]
MLKKILSLAMLLSVLCASAQERVYKDRNNKATTADLAESYEISTFNNDKTLQTIRTFRMDNSLISESSLAIREDGVMPQGKATLYNPDGSVAWFANYANGNLDGESKTFWPGGALKRDETYSAGKMLSGTCYDVNGEEIPYFPREKRPEYPGGMTEAYKFIANNFQVRGTKSGTIYLTFVVEKDGSVADIEIKKGVGKRLDQEAVRVLKSMPKWIPGTQEGVAVRTSFALPIKIAEQP